MRNCDILSALNKLVQVSIKDDSHLLADTRIADFLIRLFVLLVIYGVHLRGHLQ